MAEDTLHHKRQGCADMDTSIDTIWHLTCKFWKITHTCMLWNNKYIYYLCIYIC